jgi:hypothetical protein
MIASLSSKLNGLISLKPSPFSALGSLISVAMPSKGLSEIIPDCMAYLQQADKQVMKRLPESKGKVLTTKSRISAARSKS